MDSSIYRQILGQIKPSSLIGHYNYPCHNVISMDGILGFCKSSGKIYESSHDLEELISEFPCYEAFSYKIQSCLPFYCGSGLFDTALEMVKAKLKWERELKNIKISNINKAMKIITSLKENKLQKVPKNIAEYLVHIKNDPEPYFSGKNNWLYTGGNLASASIGDDVFLVSADCNTASQSFSILKLNSKIDKIESKQNGYIKKNSPVLQITCRANQDDLLILVRQKQNLTLFNCNTISNMDLPKKIWGKKVENKLLTSVDINWDCSGIALASTKSDVHIYDVEKKKRTFEYTYESSFKDNWNQVMLKRNCLYVANRMSLVVIDTREVNNEPHIQYSPSDITNSCEEICSVVESNVSSNYLYVGTTHNVIQIDIRTGGNLQKWTHLMKNSPQFLNSVECCNSDFLTLQSTNVNELVGIKNEFVTTDTDMHFRSRSLPCALPGVKECLRTGKLQGICFGPLVSNRFDFSITGIQCLREQNNIHLFTSNGGGDIFFSKITNSELDKTQVQDTNTEFVKYMKAYETHFQNFPSTKNQHAKGLQHFDMTRVFKDLTSSTPRHKKGKDKNKFCWKRNKKFTEDNLIMYRDVLAERILKIWQPEFQDLNHDSTCVSSEARVREWMEKM